MDLDPQALVRTRIRFYRICKIKITKLTLKKYGYTKKISKSLLCLAPLKDTSPQFDFLHAIIDVY